MEAPAVDLPPDRLETVLEDGEFVLYRSAGAAHTTPARSALVVMPRSEHPRPQAIRMLENEHSLRDELDPAWAIRSLALTRRDGRAALVLEDPGGETLARRAGTPMDVADVLRVGAGVAGALRQLHGRGLIHKDIKPANVMTDWGTGRVWLRGFGIASRLPRERRPPEPPEFIAGTLPYMAPEQTGWVNRSIDARSDLYATGVVLYELSTGNLPFTASDPMAWVHGHIAKRPVPPAERRQAIPEVVSAIVMKLLAKAAEDRYQTAAGVEYDLRCCLAQWEADGRIDAFPLAEHDTPDRLVIPEKLYGREREIQTLLDAFERVVTSGAPELVLVSGYSGIGKSSVVNEVHRVLVAPRGLFASGKLDQYKRDIPYATLAQAFQSLLRSLLGQSEATLGRWRDALREALGPNGQLIVDLVPELEVVIGKQPPAADLPPQDAKNRFQMVFRRFLGVFARQQHPLALFLDDLQWLDSATLELLEHLVTHADVRHLLLVGAYRGNEVDPAHPLVRTLAAMRKAGARVEQIVLAPLELRDIGRLIADALHSTPQRAQPLAQLVHEKTGGNPFFAIQFLTALAEDGLLGFDSAVQAWGWDIDRIRAKSYTDNVVDLIAGNLKRFSAITQEALKQLACLGNVAEIAPLTLVHGETEEMLDAALWKPVRAGLVLRQNNAYKFLHDRIQQAAYSLIPEAERALVHLRIGRVLLTTLKADQLAEHLFDVANQFNRGAGLLFLRDEKAQVAMIELRAGRKAKASAAYASACVYLATGMALLDESDWGSQYELTFNLWLERAQCEFLTGHFDTAEQLIGALLQRAASKVDQAAVYRLKVQLHVLKSENPQAVASALTCLHLFGIDLPAHPTWEQLQGEYDMVWRNLDGRPIEHLIDLPLVTDPEMQAAVHLLSSLRDAAYVTDPPLSYLLACRMVDVSMQHGTSGASTHGLASFGLILGPVFHRYSEGYRFTKLACDLVERHGFIAYRPRVHYLTGIVALWTQPIATAIDFTRTAFRTATETGDLTYACYSVSQTVASLLLRNDPLDGVWRESEMALEFVRRAGFHDMADVIVSQQRFIAAMQGRTATFPSFSDAQFDEAAFEAQLTGDRLPTKICWYWILKLKARLVAGDYAEALAAADKARALLRAATLHTRLVDYFYYTALTVAALYEKGSADEKSGWRDLLMAHQERLREWADNNPATFADKHALVLAEIARLEGREADAMRLYEQAVQAARENGFVQNEGLTYEIAARFYAGRGFETIANAYLRNARYCYLRWGAEGKVRQLDALYPRLRDGESVHDSRGTIGASVEQLELATVLKVSQAVSGEIVLEKLIDTVLRTAIEHAGAERGVLIVPRGDDLWIQADARATGSAIAVAFREAPISSAELPESIVRYSARSHECVSLDDASAPGGFSNDAYLRREQSKSVLCLPLLQQGQMMALLYLENQLAAGVFTPARMAVLNVVASQAAMSLEKSQLYQELQNREAKIRRLVDADIIGILIWDFDGRILEANDAFLGMIGYERDDLAASRIRWRDLTPPEWRERDAQTMRELKMHGHAGPFEKEYFHKDGSRVPVLLGAATFDEGGTQGVAFVLDLTERKRAAEALRETQGALARVNRATTLGMLGASIVHEVNQPLGAIAASAAACSRWLSAQPPDLDKAQRSLERIANDGRRASAVIDRLRALVKRQVPRKDRCDLNEAIREVLTLTDDEVRRNDILVETALDPDLPTVECDRIQIQQIILNLIVNAIEAMRAVDDRRRELIIGSAREGANAVRVEVRDSGPGVNPSYADRLFEAFYTTKVEGMGMGLSISRAIIEGHGGRIWVGPNGSHGAAFCFSLPVQGVS